MKRYRNKTGKSGVVGYQVGPDWITVKFQRGEVYEYTYKSAGIKHIEKMKLLAEAGKDLSTYISQHVKELYARKFFQ